MPKDVSSPFTPGMPVSLDFFVGRLREVERLKDRVSQAAQGRLGVGFLGGERGIGKSSLASFVRFVADRDDRMLGLHTYLGGVSSLEETVRRVFERLLKQSIGTSWFDKIKGLFGGHIREMGLFGVSVQFEAPGRDLTHLVRDFASAVRNLIQRVQDDKSGIFLILDDLNGLADSSDFANWLKSLVDEIATSNQPMPLYLLLVGVEECRRSMVRLQPSLARYFDLIDIEAWSNEEARDFFTRAFNRVGIKVADDALDTLVFSSGGLPMLAHELGEAAFSVDTDGRIDDVDARKAVLDAADIVGRKHLEPQVLQAVRSAKYRSILKKLTAESLAFRFRRSQVLKNLSAEEGRVFDNFLRRMNKLGVVTRDQEAGPGAYRFVNRLHAVYFWLEAQRARQTRRQ